MENWMFECKSSMDKATWMKNIFVLIIFISIDLFVYFTSGYKNHITKIILINLVYLVTLIFGLLKTPRSYHLSKHTLLINRRLNPIKIPLKSIMLIRPFEKSDRKGLYRAFASEGVVGNFGIYRSKKYRTLNVYTSRDTNWVLIETRQGKKIVISPDDISLVEKVSDYLP